jgi:hypothetical protein
VVFNLEFRGFSEGLLPSIDKVVDLSIVSCSRLLWFIECVVVYDEVKALLCAAPDEKAIHVQGHFIEHLLALGLSRNCDYTLRNYLYLLEVHIPFMGWCNVNKIQNLNGQSNLGEF